MGLVSVNNEDWRDKMTGMNRNESQIRGGNGQQRPVKSCGDCVYRNKFRCVARIAVDRWPAHACGWNQCRDSHSKSKANKIAGNM